MLFIPGMSTKLVDVDGWFTHISLRRHYPDQVQRVESLTLLSVRVSELP